MNREAIAATATAKREKLRDLLGWTRLAPQTPARVRPAPRTGGSLPAAQPPEPLDVAVELADGTTIPSFLLRPAPDRANGAGVVLIAGHGRGIDALVDRTTTDEFNAGTAHAFAAAGYTVLCPEMLSFGRRRHARPAGAVPYTPEENSCGIDAARLMLAGIPVMGRRAADAAAAHQALGALPGVDPDCVAVAGGSGGGAVALLLAAAEPKVAAALVAAYFCTFEASLCSVRHCPCNIIPGILPDFEMADIAALIAPRPLIIEHGERDHIFPIDATREAFSRLPAVWAEHDAQPPELVVTDDGHSFHAERSLTLLRERMP